MRQKLFKIIMTIASLALLCLPLGAVDLDFYGQTEIFLINYYSSPTHFQEGQKSEPNPLLLAVDRSYDRLVRVLLDLGTDVNLRDKDGISPLLWAVTKNNNTITQVLLNYNASPNNPDNKGWTPLMISAQNNNLNITRQLVNAGADVNAQNFEGSSPLLWASRNASLPLVEYLTTEGAEIEHRNLRNQTSVYIASQYGQEDILLFLLKKDPSLALVADNEGKIPLIKAVELGRYRMIDILAPYEFKGNPDNPLGSAIALAKLQGNAEMEAYLENFIRRSNTKNGMKEIVSEIPLSTETSKVDTAGDEFKSLTSIPEDVRKRILTFLGILDASTVRSVQVKRQADKTGDLWSGVISYSQNNQIRSQSFDLKIRNKT